MRNVSRGPRRKSPAFHLSESDGLQAGDSVGNRQKFSETRISADDIGNRLPVSDPQINVRDDIGNSIVSAPTHQQSGVLASFDGRRRRREAPSQDSRQSSSYAIGGVNPLVSGSHALMSMFSAKEDESVVEKPTARVRPAPIEMKTGGRAEPSDATSPNRKPEKTGDSSDRWLKRLLEFDDEERQEGVSLGDPKKKAIQARSVLSDIFDKAGVMAAIGTEIVVEPASGRTNVLVSFEDIDLTIEPSRRLSKVFSQDSLSLIALNFLVNKIVNRVPEERVRVQIVLRNSSENRAESSSADGSESETFEIL